MKHSYNVYMSRQIYNEGTFLNIFTGLHYLFKSELDEVIFQVSFLTISNSSLNVVRMFSTSVESSDMVFAVWARTSVCQSAILKLTIYLQEGIKHEHTSD